MIVFRFTLALITLAVVASSLQAVEPRLRLGPNELTAEAAIMNRYVRDGVTRIDSTTFHAAGSARFLNFGINLDTFTALDDDNDREIGSLEIDEARLRLDYLLNIAGVEALTIIPFFETSLYPGKGNARTYNGATANRSLRVSDWESEALWLGSDVWYKLPYAGFEVGGSLAADIDGSAGIKGGLGARQFVQVGTIDIASYQKINFSDKGYRDHVIGINRHGLTTGEIGVTLTVPVPIEGLYVSAFAQAHIWLDSKSRDAVERDSVLVGGVSVSFRPSDFGW